MSLIHWPMCKTCCITVCSKDSPLGDLTFFSTPNSHLLRSTNWFISSEQSLDVYGCFCCSVPGVRMKGGLPVAHMNFLWMSISLSNFPCNQPLCFHDITLLIYNQFKACASFLALFPLQGAIIVHLLGINNLPTGFPVSSLGPLMSFLKTTVAITMPLFYSKPSIVFPSFSE